MNHRPADLHKSIEAAKALRKNLAAVIVGPEAEPRQMSDDDLRALQDTFDGETTLDAELRAALLAEDEDKILIDGIKEREKELSERRRRAERRIEVRRGLMEQAMAIAEWPKFQTDIGTFSLGKAKPRIEIDNEAEIPSQFFKPPEPAPPALDKQGLLAVLTERHKLIEAAAGIEDEAIRTARLRAIDDMHPEIPGCHLETGGVALTIRRK